MSRQYGFSLIEVLVSLAIGSLVLGVVMNNVSRSVVSLAKLEPRYRALITANSVLEKAAAEHSTSSESGMKNDLAYSIASSSVQADSRVLELKATVTDSSGRPVSLSIYRLRSLSANTENTTSSQ